MFRHTRATIVVSHRSGLAWVVNGYVLMAGGLLLLGGRLVGVAIGAGIGVSSALMPRIGVKAVLAVGLLGSAAGLLVASYIHVDSSYAGGILPGLIVFGVFSGICHPA
jgi:hypothetical protein